jgi:divalent metal cation (Fe/Co/Zn/Cd) transporter
VEDSIKRLAAADPCIRQVNGVITVHLAPDQIMAALSLEFEDSLATPAIEDRVEQLEARVRAAHPDVIALFIKPQKPERFREMRRKRFGLKSHPSLPKAAG